MGRIQWWSVLAILTLAVAISLAVLGEPEYATVATTSAVVLAVLSLRDK